AFSFVFNYVVLKCLYTEFRYNGICMYHSEKVVFMSRLLFVVVFICFLDLFIALPIITPFAFSLGATEYLAGVLVAAYSFVYLLGNVSGGYLSDKIGRRNIF